MATKALNGPGWFGLKSNLKLDQKIAVSPVQSDPFQNDDSGLD